MSKKPILIVLAGPNGSGKTSITEEVLSHVWAENCTYVNPDEIAKNDFGNWNDPNIILQAAQKAEKIRNQCIAEKKGLIFETVFSAQDKIDFIFNAKKNGYFIRFFFISTDHPSINASRIAIRVMNGGHDVPIPKIINRYSKSIGNCKIIADTVDRLYVYDNSIDQQKPALLFKGKNGILSKKYQKINPWAEEIFSVLYKEIEQGKQNAILPEIKHTLTEKDLNIKIKKEIDFSKQKEK